MSGGELAPIVCLVRRDSRGAHLFHSFMLRAFVPLGAIRSSNHIFSAAVETFRPRAELAQTWLQQADFKAREFFEVL